jgi:hypothetical protein
LNATRGDRKGYELFDRWSSDGNKYKGVSDTAKLWDGLRLDHPHPIAFGTLRYLIAVAGHEWVDVCGEAEADFELVDGEAV